LIDQINIHPSGKWVRTTTDEGNSRLSTTTSGDGDDSVDRGATRVSVGGESTGCGCYLKKEKKERKIDRHDFLLNTELLCIYRLLTAGIFLRNEAITETNTGKSGLHSSEWSTTSFIKHLDGSIDRILGEITDIIKLHMRIGSDHGIHGISGTFWTHLRTSKLGHHILGVRWTSRAIRAGVGVQLWPRIFTRRFVAITIVINETDCRDNIVAVAGIGLIKTKMKKKKKKERTTH
jgi:hypothetical protein